MALNVGSYVWDIGPYFCLARTVSVGSTVLFNTTGLFLFYVKD